MGRIVNRQVVAIACELRSCELQVAINPVSWPSTWHDEVQELHQLVEDGWALVLTPQLRAYCPEHASRAWDCSCRTHPTRARLCPAHSNETAALVWTDLREPIEVREFLQVMEVRS